MIIPKRALAVCCAVVASGSAFAATTTSQMTITATIDPACQILSMPTPTSNGTVGTLYQAPNATISTTCSAGVPYSVTVDSGLNGAMFFRQMTDGNGNFFSNDIYDADTLSWIGDQGYADTFPFGAPANRVGNGASQDVHLAFWINPGSVAGVYSDTVTVTLTY